MFKFIVYGVAIAAAFGGSVISSEARQINVWGHNLTVDDGNGSASNFTPAPTSDFNAVVAQPERYRLRTHRLEGFGLER